MHFFDRLILMIDGHIIFQGAANKSTEYFNSIGFNIPRFANPADYYMKILSVNYPKEKVDEDKINLLKLKYEQRLLPQIAVDAMSCNLPGADDIATT